MELSYYNWNNYKNEVKNYLHLLNNNPYIDELEQNFKQKEINRFLKFFTQNYKIWINGLINNAIIPYNYIDEINTTVYQDIRLHKFVKYIEEHVNFKDFKQLKKVLENIDEINEIIIKDIPRMKYSPTPLKFVTTTAIATINSNIEFKEIYNNFVAPDNLPKDKNNIYYNDCLIGKAIGCKTGDLQIKGFFKKDTLGDFYNCTTLNVVLTNTKSANIKVFNNGKLQMTGVPSPDSGKVAVKYVCNLIKELSKKTKNIVKNAESINIIKYKTSMINTCYKIGFCINRPVLYNLLLHKYNINTIYESEGYPGVRVEYYYNTNNLHSIDTEGRCLCKNEKGELLKCKGKGSGSGNGNCRKISIAIFQSGSSIIAGGCETEEPIFKAYNFINTILKDNIEDIYKVSNKILKTEYIYINKSNLINPDTYNKLVTNKIIAV